MWSTNEVQNSEYNLIQSGAFTIEGTAVSPKGKFEQQFQAATVNP